MLKGNVNFEPFNTERITTFDWDGFDVDISDEIGSGSHGKRSIQSGLKEFLEKRGDYSHILFDHGSGEVADFVTFKTDGSFIRVEFYHCKAKKGAGYNSNLADVYEVAQQAVKSTVWLKSKASLLSRIQNRIKGRKDSKFLRGDMRTLKELLKSQRAMEVTIYIVQPAISKGKPMSDSFGKVLSAAAFYIRHTGRAKELMILGSK